MSGRRGTAAAVLATALVLLTAACGGGPGEVTRVLFVTLDTTRADRLGCYGYEQAVTPALDALAAESVLFEHAVSPVPTTLPSHASMFTGLYPQDHGVRYNLFYKLNQEAETLAEALQAAGFRTAAFPATQIVARRFGLDQGFADWHEPPTPTPSETAMEHPIAPLRPAKEGVDLALDWFARQGDGRAFAWLHFYDPHWPYDPPFPWSSSHRERPYDGEIAYVDAQLGRLLERLRADPQWAKTLVVVVGDHGEGLYEHGERYHSTLLYETTQHVPLIVRAPGVAPRRVEEPVSLTDLMPTVLDLVGLARPGLRGRSLRPALVGDALEPRDVYAETLAGAINYGWAELYSVRFGPWKLIDSSSPELYDLDEDPEEIVNLASLEAERLQELRGALETLATPLTAAGNPEEAVVELDPATEAMLSSLGYVAGGVSGSRAGDAPHPRDLVHLEAELLAAQAVLARREYAQVEEVCRYVLERDPGNLWAHASLTTALTGLERFDEAVAAGRELVERNPDGEQAWVLLTSAWLRQEKTAEAYDVILEGLERLPESERLTYLRLVGAFELEHDDVCSVQVPEASRAHPDSGRIAMLTARCRARDGDTAGALAALEQAAGLGFREFEGIEEAPDFAALADTDGFRALKESVQKTDASGVDGPRPNASE